MFFEIPTKHTRPHFQFVRNMLALFPFKAGVVVQRPIVIRILTGLLTDFVGQQAYRNTTYWGCKFKFPNFLSLFVTRRKSNIGKRLAAGT
jgi:hypothetical protein